MSLRSGQGSPDVIARPWLCPAQGPPVVPFLSPRGVRNDRAFHRARGAMCSEPDGFRVHREWSAHGKHSAATEAAIRLRSAREWTLRLAACPRGCRWRRRAPVRASCRPDMHLDRPPVLPASVPVRSLGSAILNASRVRHRSGHPHPAPRFEDDRHAPLTGTGWPINFPKDAAKSSDGGTKSKIFVF